MKKITPYFVFVLNSTPLFDFVYGVHVAPMFLIFSFLPSALANGFAQFAQSQLFKIVCFNFASF